MTPARIGPGETTWNPTKGYALENRTMILLPCAIDCFTSLATAHFVFLPVPHGQGFT
jgi:hypothetical protein